MKFVFLHTVILISTSVLAADDYDIRIRTLNHLMSFLEPKTWPSVAIVKELNEFSNSVVLFSDEEIDAILEGTKFEKRELIPGRSIDFPGPEKGKKGFRDSRTGLEIYVISITRILLKEKSVHVSYSINGGFLNASGGIYEVSKRGDEYHFKDLGSWES